MSEVPALVTEKFPQHLKAKAIQFDSDLAWRISDISEVLIWLEMEQLAVVGVEVWHIKDDAPQWIATSNYDCQRNQLWEDFVKCCSQEARQFAEKNVMDKEAFFNLTWISSEDFQRFKGR